MMSNLLNARGAIAAPLFLEVIRELVPADLIDLINAPAQAVPVLQRIRAIHHRQAVLLAEGRTINEVAAIVGTTPARLQQLTKDPAFSELMGYYKDQIITAMLEDAARIKDKLVDAGEMAVDEMIVRLESDQLRSAMPIGEVRKIAEMALDRTVAPPKATSVAPPLPTAITLNFGTSPGPIPLSPEGGPVVDQKSLPVIDQED